MSCEIQKISEHPELIARAAGWFSSKFGVPEEAYLESMTDALTGHPVPEWYVMTDGGRIIAGLGVIDNDFHPRRDLTPNVCAVYVEKDCRGHALAGVLLGRICADLHAAGYESVYLLTDHIGFYEHYGWEYFCPVVGDGETEPCRVYIHRQ